MYRRNAGALFKGLCLGRLFLGYCLASPFAVRSRSALRAVPLRPDGSLLPKRVSQMRNEDPSRVNAETPSASGLGFGNSQNDADQFGLPPQAQALADAHRPDNCKGHRRRARYGGSPSPSRSAGPCRQPPQPLCGSYPKAALATASSRRATRALASALASLRKTEGVRSFRLSAPS